MSKLSKFIKNLFNRDRKGVELAVIQFLQDSLATIYRYNTKDEHVEILNGNKFEEIDISWNEIENKLHPSSKAKFNMLFENIKTGKMTKASTDFLVLDEQRSVYTKENHTILSFEDKNIVPKWIYIIVRNIEKNIETEQKLYNANRWLELASQVCKISLWNFSTEENRFSYPEQAKFNGMQVTMVDELLKRTHTDDRRIVEGMTDILKRRRNKAFNLEFTFDIDGKQTWSPVQFFGLPTSIDEKGFVSIYTGYMLNKGDRYELERNLEKATKEAERSNSLKDSFVQNISHYFRTPLNSIMGFAQIISDCDSEEERNMCLAQMQKNNGDLLLYINELLEYSTVSAQYIELKKEEFEVGDVLEEVWAYSMAKAENGVNIRYEKPYETFVIEWDKEQLNMMCTRLLKNALRYTQQGDIVVGIIPTPEGLELWVEYDGFNPNILDGDAMYSSFEKPDFNDSLDSLELCLCKMVAEYAKGTINASTDKTKSSISINIPCHIVNIM